MILYKISFFADPRKVLAYQMEKGGNFFEKLIAELEKKLALDRVITLEKNFNMITVVTCSNAELSEDVLAAVYVPFSESQNLGKLTLKMTGISKENVLKSEGLGKEDIEYINQIQAVEPVQENMVNTNNAAAQSGKSEDIFAEIDNFVAMDELKEWAEEMKTLLSNSTNMPMLQRAVAGMSYLLSVNPGNGASTAVKAMGAILAKIRGKNGCTIKEVAVEPDAEKKQQYNVDAIISDISNVGPDEQTLHVYALRIERMQGNHFIMQWLALLSAVWKHGKNAAVIFMLPYLEKSALDEMHRRIEDLVPNRVIRLRPMDNGGYMQVMDRYFAKFDMKIQEDAYQSLMDKIAEEKSDGRFYGIHTVHKICDELLYNKIKDAVLHPEGDENVITVSDVNAVMHQPIVQDGKSGMEQLDSLVALQTVKNMVKEIVATIKMQRVMNAETAHSMHMMFSGAPGTGKTVVARILGKIFREERLLSVGAFFEVSRKDLVGSYVGHTAPKTAEMCQTAYGSVLFIDEAYSLCGEGNDYGKEAISTLIAEMENKRDDFVVIFAGYEKELAELFDMNPGLRDRIPYRVHFDNYNREELCEIFYMMLPDGFVCQEDFKTTANTFFLNLSDEVLLDKNFSNGRFVRNMVERVMSKAALRMQINKSQELSFVKSDMELAMADIEVKSLNEKKNKHTRIGFQFD